MILLIRHSRIAWSVTALAGLLFAAMPVSITSAAQSKYVAVAKRDAKKYGLVPRQYVEQIRLESHFNPNLVGPDGDEGILQLTPATAKEWHVNPFHPKAVLIVAASHEGRWYKSWRKKHSSRTSDQLTYAQWNVGIGPVLAALKKYGSKWLANMPKETRNYVNAIVG